MHRLLILPFLALTSPALAEVATSAESGFVVKLEAETPAAKSDVWKMLIAPAQWWSPEHTYTGDAANLYLDAQATGCFCEKLPRPKDAPEGQRMGSVEHMRIVYADPQNGVLRMAGGLGPLQSEAMSGALTIALKQGAAGTRIEWTYVAGGFMRMKMEEIAPLVDKVLGEQLQRLAAKLTPAVLAPDTPAP